MVNTDRHGKKGKWRLPPLPRPPEAERSFKEGCLSDTVYVVHPEAAAVFRNHLSGWNEWKD